MESKKQRTVNRVFVAEGEKIIAEFMRSSVFKVQGLFAVKEWISANENLLHKTGRKAVEFSEKELEQSSFLTSPNKVLGVFEIPEWKTDDSEIKNSFSIALDRIRDPGNLGTIIRTADWFGIKNIFCSEDCVDCFSPKVVQATMGSLARVKIHYQVLEKLFEQCRQVKVYGAAAGESDVFNTKFTKAGFVLIGNESEGISEQLQKFVTDKISVARFVQRTPSGSRAESLNAAIATSIICAVYRNQFFM